jgi:hypothetical protein
MIVVALLFVMLVLVVIVSVTTLVGALLAKSFGWIPAAIAAVLLLVPIGCIIWGTITIRRQTPDMIYAVLLFGSVPFLLAVGCLMWLLRLAPRHEPRSTEIQQPPR